ncbi:MAG: AMP-binding protein [Actinomycetota bacterium]
MSDTGPCQISLSVENWGKSTPHDIAVLYENRSLTFAELNGEINSFARILDEKYGRETLLPILVGVNLNSYIAITAAIRASIGFTPIDSSNPPEAISEILAELGNPRHIIISNRKANSFIPDGCTPIYVEEVNGTAGEFESKNVNKDDLAMILFTSGSTGKPKGVMFSWHLLNQLDVERSRYHSELGEITRLGVHNSLGYLFGFLRSLAVGHGSSIAIQDPFLYTPDELIAKMNEADLSHIGLVPTLLEKIADGRSPNSRLLKIRHVTLAGENTNWDQVEKIREMTHPQVRINAMFGASEVQYLPFEFSAGDRHGVGNLPFDRIIFPEKTVLTPLDESSQLLELRLYEPVALGYFKDPELTAQKFGVDTDGRRYYIAGDLFKRDEDGLLHHAGRVDDLVKINGRLVEPSESEKVLRQIPDIESVAVLPHYNAANKAYLVAHLKIASGSTLTPNSIYDTLLSKLASNLVPSMLVKHDALPLNERGKLDRQYLIGTSWERWSDKSETPPLSATEIFTQRSIGRILAKPDIDLNEDLFGVGMDSFAALEFISMAREYGYENFTPNVFIQNRTIKTVAQMLDTKREKDLDSALILNSLGSITPIFCFPGGGLTALWYRELAIEVGTDQPLAIIEARGLHSDDLPDRSIEEHAQRAVTEIQRLQPLGTINIIGHSAGGTIAYETCQLLAAQKREVNLVLLDSHTVIEKLRMPTTSWRALFLARRIRTIFSRSRVAIIERLLVVSIHSAINCRVKKLRITKPNMITSQCWR